MVKKRAYRATAVKSVSLDEVVRSREGQAVTVGADVGKEEVFGVLRWEDGRFERPWKVKNPGEIPCLVGLLGQLGQGRRLKVGMESSGTYGEALRQALTDAKLDVHRVSGKAVHDYAEIFDGVPSQHDGKDAAIVAELVALGKSSPWPYQAATDIESEMAYWVEWLDIQQRIETMWLGRLESLLARFWPEVKGLLKLTSKTLWQALAEYGGTRTLGEDPAAAERLARWSRRTLDEEKIEALLRSARETLGVRPAGHDRLRIQRCAAAVLAAHREVCEAKEELNRLGEDNAIIKREAAAVGMATACVLWVAVGNPCDYPCGEAYRKAMGLNLRERSSGKHQGKLKITKRGSAMARRWIYFAAMRCCQDPSVRGWYEAKKARDQDRGVGALIGIARKLSLALHRMAVHEEAFEPWRLFPGHLRRSRPGNGQALEKSPAPKEPGGPAPQTPRDLSLGANPGDEKHADHKHTDRKQSGASQLAPSPVSASGRRSGRVPAEPYPPSGTRKSSTSRRNKEPNK